MIWVYGCMPSGGGGEKKCTHKKKDVLVWAQWGWIFEVLSLETKNKS